MNYVPLAPEFLGLVIAAWISCAVAKRRLVCVIAASITAFVLLFFRGAGVPSRIERTALYCPCDGTVQSIIDHGMGYYQVCVFLGVTNVHVQYSPCDCTVHRIRHVRGAFHPAYLHEKSACNERVEYEMHSAVFGRIRVVQIAGQLARRIVPFVKVGDRLPAMARLGMIKLGSRCDVYFKGMPLVASGERVRVGDFLAQAR